MQRDLFDEHPEDDYPPPPKGFCSECGDECEAILVDFGIGPYEYWGQKGCDTNKQWVSPCCEAELLDSPPERTDDEEAP